MTGILFWRHQQKFSEFLISYWKPKWAYSTTSSAAKKTLICAPELLIPAATKIQVVMTTELTKEMTVLLRKKKVIKAAGNLINSGLALMARHGLQLTLPHSAY